jgi:hypothetical protein
VVAPGVPTQPISLRTAPDSPPRSAGAPLPPGAPAPCSASSASASFRSLLSRTQPGPYRYTRVVGIRPSPVRNASLRNQVSNRMAAASAGGASRSPNSAVGLLKVPDDDSRCAVHARPTDGARRIVIQQMKEGGQPCDVFRSFRGHVPDRCVAATAGEFMFDGVVGLGPGGMGRCGQVQHGRSQTTERVGGQWRVEQRPDPHVEPFDGRHRYRRRPIRTLPLCALWPGDQESGEKTGATG